MSRLPQLEAQLVAAAATHRAASPWRGRIAALAAAATCAAAVLTLTARHSPAPAVPAEPTVPPATLALSQALVAAPEPERNVFVAHAELPAVAAALMARTPYPPGLRDGFDWAATPRDPHDMSSINYRDEVQRLVEYRSYCLWLRFWIRSQDVPDALAGADTVLAQVPQWPTQRTDDYARKIARAAQVGDAATIQHELDLNCRGV
jgi:hypothetical protein